MWVALREGLSAALRGGCLLPGTQSLALRSQNELWGQTDRDLLLPTVISMTLPGELVWHSIDLFAISVLVWFSPTTNLLATTLHICASPTLVNMGKSMALGQSLHVGCGKETTGEFVQRHQES